MIPLFTSIPPQMARQSKGGKEIGREYALECIQSWRDSGFDPVTVNAESEGVSELVRSEGIGLITLKRNASEQFGRPLVYLDDFINVARSLADGPVVVTNADILLDVTPAMQQQISNIRPGQCLLSRRTDIRDPDSREGQEYTYGYDFFACHSQDLARYANHDFVFGMPWWDHYLPIHMFLSDLKPLQVERPFAFHLAHPERWEPDHWIRLGRRFLRTIRSESSGNRNGTILASEYLHRCELAALGSDASLASRARAMLRRMTKQGRRENDIQTLYRIAELNMQWLDELGSRPT
ncbi:MAG TPA: hypothetical protein VI566_04145 [Xanthomonadales bacterium]|nr:hypothetical protein [Xanthomonadales bacterium]